MEGARPSGPSLWRSVTGRGDAWGGTCPTSGQTTWSREPGIRVGERAGGPPPFRVTAIVGAHPGVRPGKVGGGAIPRKGRSSEGEELAPT